MPSSMGAPSPKRRKSLALTERSMNHDVPSRKNRTLSLGGEHTMTASWDLLSQAQKDRRTRQPRKSILKLDPQPEPEKEEPEEPSAPSRKSMGLSRRVSFAAAAHVRMFENPDKDKKRRKSSMGGRRSSIQITHIPPPQVQVQVQSPKSPRSPRGPKSPRRVQSPHSPVPRYFVGEGEGAGEESMEMSEDESVASADSDEILAELTSPRAEEGDSSVTESEDEDQEMDMEETTVMDAQIQQWTHADESEEDMSLEETSASDEEKTMDFTVALGGPMPSVPPQDARPNRAPLGYMNPSAPGQTHAAPLHPGDETDSSVMEETAVYGGVYDESISSGDDTGHSGQDLDGRTTTYNFNTTAMEFTSVVGGIHGQSTTAGDDTMEMTMAVGGIHAEYTSHTAHTDMEFSTAHTAMDFTTAIGGIHAQQRADFTTTASEIHTSQTGMDFTAAVGGIHQHTRTNIFDTTTSTNIFDTSRPNIFATDDHLGQTQTGLMYPVLEPARAEDASSASASTSRSRSTPRKSTSTPSFMRPTTASAQKSKDKEKSTKKRNVFAESPETPGLQRSKSRTPTGMEAAGSVAKRLSFAPPAAPAANVFAPSATSATPSSSQKAATPRKSTPRKSLIPRRSGTPKRPREEDAAEPPAKRPNIFAMGDMETPNLFSEPAQATEPAAEPAALAQAPEVADEPEAAAGPEAAADPEPEPEEEDMEIEEDEQNEADSPGSPERFYSPEPAPLPPVISNYTPIRERRSSVRRKSMGTPVRPSPRPPARSPTPEEQGPIRLSRFLEMTNVEFMDHLPVAARRNSVGRGLLGTEDREFALHDFVSANVEAVHVNFFQWAIDKMVADIRDMGTELSGIEAALDEENPIVVREYLSATEEERPIFEMMLREYKANTVLRARSSWYDWKTSIMERIRPDVRGIRDEMAEDAARFRAQMEVGAKLLPDLRSRHEQLKAELAAHRAAVERIEACDQEELKELKAGVAEQNAEIERFTAELDDKTSRVAELEAKAAQLTAECDAHIAATDAARAESSESSPADVLRLEAEFRALQDLHGWRILRASPLTLEYAGELELTVPLVGGRADIGAASLDLTRAADGPTPGLLELTRRALVHARPASLAALARATGQLWTAARRVRDELNILQLYYPATFAADERGLTVAASVILPSKRAKVSLSFALGPGTLLAWPSVHAVAAVRVHVDVVYGSADALGIQNAAQDTLAGVVPDVPGVFYQACASAVEA